ncbi:MAG: TonB-dependent receptor [Candidatus Andeanibacterium colombiense]|uniref:TonB-dependent receptor n=1 Tax=Candidatus Andeanibacterium colombiense TaxID=3121345 RepID=A0AAJ5X435_9SPHN|nr:MAG: TonB-dependent receptor [Sphingomonadaceae bacterium]
MSKMNFAGGAYRRRLAGGTSWAALSLAAVAALASPTAARAQDVSPAKAESATRVDIPAQPLGEALRRFAEQTGIQLGYSTDLVAGKRSAAVSGTLSPRDALAHLLAGTGLVANISGNNATIRAPGVAAADGEQVTAAVNVEGVQGSPWFGGAGQAAGVNGVNGSRDITATEGTGSFTSGALTIGSKVPQALKDVPQSISVLTSERLEQQNVTDFTTAMRQLPGVTLAQGPTTLDNTFYSRGFAITSIQVDGGAPLSTNYNYSPQIDMSIYDHVELLRGAAGQFGSYGDPGGTVNLVRKKPLDHAQISVEAQAGSWSDYRVVTDATSPLALDGKLRGRLVMTYQDNHHFYETAKDNKTLIYGIAELDVTPTTLVTAGINYTRQDSVPWQNGLPRYLNGDDLKLPRSTCLCFDWNRWDFDTTEFFGSVEQKIGEDWTAKFDLTRNTQGSTRKIGYNQGAVNPTNGLGPQLYGSYYDLKSSQFSAEGTLAGSFTVFGQRQEVTIGVNRSSSNGVNTLGYDDLISISPPGYQPYPGGSTYCNDYGEGGCPAGSIPTNPPLDVLDFDPSNPLYTEPRNPLPSYRYPGNGQVQYGAYINLRLTAFDRLHLTTSLHWSRYSYNYGVEYLCTTTSDACAGKAIGDVYDTPPATPYKGDDFSWPPAINLSFDVTKALSIYAGYTDIYQSQAYYVDVDLNPLPPVTGANWEGGIKWAARGGRLNISLAAYRLRQKGYGTGDPDNPDFIEVSPGIYCCNIVDPNQVRQSQGIDFEATGEILPGWQISASYTYSANTYEGSSWGSNEGTPFVSIQPKQLYKLWMSYDFAAAGRVGLLSKLAISGGVNGQSSGYRTGYTCVRFVGNPNPVTGAQTCAPNTDPANPSRVQYEFTVPAYALLSARIDYNLSDTWSLALNLENILDKTYYQTTGNGVLAGHWYGAPRSYTASLHAKW